MSLRDNNWFDRYQPNESYYLPKMLRQHLRVSGERANAQDPAGT